jgi:hypothetical protein
LTTIFGEQIIYPLPIDIGEKTGAETDFENSFLEFIKDTEEENSFWKFLDYSGFTPGEIEPAEKIEKGQLYIR